MSDPGASTARTFADKWSRNPELALELTLDEGSEIAQWILTRNGWGSGEGLAAYLSRHRRILDAGCGNGRVTALLQKHAPADCEIVAVDLTAADVARENLAELPNVTVDHADVLADLSEFGSFDFVYCQEVLQHTSDPKGGLANLASRLAPGGEIAIYVYGRKPPVREFTDEYLRDRVSALSYEEAMEVSRKIAELGRALAEVGATVRVPAIEQLGIEEGEYDVQRLIYHFFMKCFWNDQLDAEGNAVVNYDWYHPQISSTHTPEEVRGWFAEADLDVVQEHTDHYGITMRGARRS
jgi:SAM-dependent methyltransferase